MNSQQIRILTALPVYNEESHLKHVLPQVLQYAQDVLLVDDGSTDLTAEILQSMQAEFHQLEIIRHTKNQGYGAALRTAFQYALSHQYDVLVTIDCDGQHQPALIPVIAAEVFQSSDFPWDLISGSRYLVESAQMTAAPVERRQINQIITSEVNARLNFRLTDTFCGMKAYRVDSLAALQITETGYAMPLQLWVQAAAMKWRIKEFPVPLIYLDEKRSFGGSLDIAEQRLNYYRQVLDREYTAWEQTFTTCNLDLLPLGCCN